MDLKQRSSPTRHVKVVNMLSISNAFLILFFSLVSSCQSQHNASSAKIRPESVKPSSIGSIPVPEGFQRFAAESGSFSNWIRTIPLREDPTVYLYNGRKKANQNAQYAVVDWDILGMKNLQCADVVMWIRAKWQYQQKAYSNIHFSDQSGTHYRFCAPYTETHFRQFMNQVFAFCGSASLEPALHPKAWQFIEPGDVVIQGGYPGHAMLVADVVMNKKGEKRFLLLQGYMPAQDIHIVRNPQNPETAWYSIPGSEAFITAEYSFRYNCLRSW